MKEFGFAILPLKLRLVVESTTSPSAGIPWCVPTQGPQPGLSTTPSVSINVWIKPSLTACKNIFFDAGPISNLTPRCTFLPFNIFAAILKSSNLPLVQEPMKTWSIFVPSTFPIGTTLSTLCGFAICGSRLLTS